MFLFSWNCLGTWLDRQCRNTNVGVLLALLSETFEARLLILSDVINYSRCRKNLL